jgi:DNA polymerase III delta prime subunit
MESEVDMQSVATAVREHKVLNGRVDSPVTYKDFAEVFDAAAEARRVLAARRPDKNIKTPWQELDALVGNDGIKSEIHKMVDLLRLDKQRRAYGLPPTQLTRHSLFFGSPGTSKTTVARLIAKIMQHEGIIKGASFRECSKSDIIGQYVGHTAANVDSLFNELAEDGGGVLFLDEAYTYTQDQTVFDKEAVNCIVQQMDTHRDIMCIFAGYRAPMQQFVEANPGLKSRIGFVFEFPSYGVSEMCDIAAYQAKALGFALPHGSDKALAEYFNELIKLQGDAFGNGREARKLVEAAALELASRLARQRRQATKADVSRLTVGDVDAAIKNSLARERTFAAGERRRIGFGA